VSNTVETHQPMVSETSMLHKENPVIGGFVSIKTFEDNFFKKHDHGL